MQVPGRLLFEEAGFLANIWMRNLPVDMLRYREDRLNGLRLTHEIVDCPSSTLKLGLRKRSYLSNTDHDHDHDSISVHVRCS